MEIRELEIFLTVAEQLHFGRASQACNLSPSALTRTIQRMEEKLEQPLFLRDNRKVILSPAGERLKSYARLCIEEWNSFRSSIKNEAIAGTLSIYASITAVYSLLPQLLESFRASYPEVQLELRTGAAEQAIAQVQSGEIDLAVAALPDRQRSTIEFLPMVTIPLIFIAPKLQGVVSAPLKAGRLDLSRAPLVLPQTGLSRRRLDHWLKDHRITPNITSEVSGNEAIIAMVRLGCGVGVVPELVWERSPFRDEVAVVDKAPRLDPYVVGLACSKRNLQRPGVRAFWELAQAQLAAAARP